ncbi:MAG: DUF5016 domain-containing protein [Tidjanibacter sp.]|nr:DUF5016 domain-containing protein [Tidjanibacter sp.]
MKHFYTSVLVALCVATTLTLASCEQQGEIIYVDEPYKPTLTLDLASDLPQSLYLSDTLNFAVKVTSRYAPIASLTTQVILGEEVFAERNVTAAATEGDGKQIDFSGSVPIPFVPNAPTGIATLRFTATNVNGGKREFDYALPIERPQFDHLVLVHQRGTYNVPRIEGNTYHLEANIPDDENAYLQTPPFGPKNRVVTFKLASSTGGVRTDSRGNSGIPMGVLADGKKSITLNTENFHYFLPNQAYLHKVQASEQDGTPPAESPFYDIVLSRNKKAIDSHGRAGNRITNAAGQVVKFKLKPGSQVIDGYSGRVRSTILYPEVGVMVNVGSKRVINGKPCFFGFSFGTDKGGQSGWIYEENVDDPEMMAQCGDDFRVDLTPQAVEGDAPVQFRVVAEDPKPWAELKVRKGISRAENVAVSDYLDRGDGTVYTLYALPYFGGFANDANIGDGQPIFIPDAGVPRMILKVFLPSDPIEEDRIAYSDPAKKQMEWVFGRIGDCRGWIPVLDLEEIK